MSANPEYWSSANCVARAERFGRFLVCWRKACGWSQYDLGDWSKAADFEAPAAGSQSNLERGRVPYPRMALFAGLAEANRRIVARDFSGVTERRLRDRLDTAVPVLDTDGQPWGFDEFVHAMHLPHCVSGELWAASAVSQALRPELTPAELDRVNGALLQEFRAWMPGYKPPSRALKLATAAAPAGEAREALEAALLGAAYDAATLAPLWDTEAGEWAPLVWWRAARAANRSGNG